MSTVEDLLPGGRWLPQSDKIHWGALKAMAVGMAASPTITRSICWTEGLQERDFHTQLRAIWVERESVWGKPDRKSAWFDNTGSRLEDVMICWHERNQGGENFDLYIIGEYPSAAIKRSRSSAHKPVIIQKRGKVWYGYGYFAEFSGPRTWAELQVRPASRQAEAVPSTDTTSTIPTDESAVQKSAVTASKGDAEAQSTTSSLAIMTMDDLVPRGRWLSTPGSDFESATYAMAMGISADVNITRPLIWARLSPEKLVYDSLKNHCNSALLKTRILFEPLSIMRPQEISHAVRSWNEDSNPKLHLFAEVNKEITQLVIYEGEGVTKSILIRRNGSRWEGCTYFQDESPEDLETNPRTTKCWDKDSISLIIYPAITIEDEAAHAASTPNVDEDVGSTFVTELQTVVSLSNQLLVAASGINPAMEKLAISLNKVEPGPRAAIQPILDRVIRAFSMPDSASPEASSSNNTKDTKVEQSTASVQPTTDKVVTSTASYYDFDRDDSASDSD
ncbi:hypothetical protein D6D04_06760 [Aureobasidium pullulans]|nr:hypothetical protein D6D04_06760 [Aureobasidium pullulans]